VKEQDKLDRMPSVLPWVVGIAALFLVIAYVAAFHTLPTTESPSAWGAFGDYVGGVLNPLVSTFTLVVAVKVWRQQKIELAETKKALDEQAKTAEQQRQEQRFFDLLNVYYRTVESIQIDMPPVRKFDTMLAVNDRAGKAAIHTWLEDRATQIGDLTKNFGDHVDELTDRQHLFGYLEHDWYHHQGTQLFGAYLRTIESILTTASLVLRESQDRYMQLFRSQLSQSELVLIGAFLLLGDAASMRLRVLSEQHGLLAHIADCDLRALLQIHIPTVLVDPVSTHPLAPLEKV
jgi:hypothetical protein